MLTALVLAAALAAPGQPAEKRNPRHCRPTSVQCWAPQVTYRELAIGGLDGDAPSYVTRVVRLVDGEHDFEQRSDAAAYIQDVLMVKGFWTDHVQVCDGDGVACLLIPPAAFERVQLVQVVDR